MNTSPVSISLTMHPHLLPEMRNLSQTFYQSSWIRLLRKSTRWLLEAQLRLPA